MAPSDEWTTVHDLALIYCGLACVDRDLTDAEVSAIEELLRRQMTLSADRTAQEVVRKAAGALRESQNEVRRAVERVRRELEPEDRREMLRHLLHIAEADGVLLGTERELIHVLAKAWNLKQFGEESPTLGDGQRREEDWGLLQELAVLFVQVERESGDELTSAALGAMANRLQEWGGDHSNEQIRAVVQQALETGADREEFSVESTAETLGAALSPVQHLMVLDDLQAVAQAHPSSSSQRQALLRTLADAWDLSVRVADL